MCGISGIIDLNRTFKSHELKDRLHNMLKIIKHRGPDHTGIYETESIFLGHNRLSIIDLSVEGNQPMVVENNFAITYNGELYNYKIIREELIDNGILFNTNSDTEVVLKAYIYWGEACVNKFNGMWAFSIYDSVNKKIFCSRDRFGIKPFHFYQDYTNVFYFCSEIKGILPYLDNKTANSKVLLQFLVTGKTDIDDQTFFNNVNRLLPGHNLIIDLEKKEINIEKYYYLEKSNNVFSSSIQTKKVEELFLTQLKEAISLHTISDVEIAYCLSGGLDSSTLVMIGEQIKNSDNITKVFTIGNAYSQDLDEILSKRLSEEIGLEQYLIKPDENDFLNVLNKVIYHQEEPFNGTSILVQNLLMKNISENNIKVVLDGQGADELLLGYRKYVVVLVSNYFKKYGIIKTLKLIKRISFNNENFSYFEIAKYIIASIFPNIAFFQLFRKFPFLKKEYKKIKHFSIYKHFITESLKSKQKIQNLELFSTNLPGLLRYEDRNSMAYSIESRVPYLDFKLVEFCYNLNIETLIEDGYMKGLIRRIGILPEYIRGRKKKLGFNSPMEIYLSKNKELVIEKIKKSSLIDFYCNKKKILNNFETIDTEVLWRLFNISYWEEEFQVQI